MMAASSTALFLFVLKTSLQASVLAALVLTLQFTLARWGRWKLSPRACHILWLVVLARLMIPGTWNTPWGFSLGGQQATPAAAAISDAAKVSAIEKNATRSTANKSRVDAASVLVSDNFGMKSDATAVDPKQAAKNSKLPTSATRTPTPNPPEAIVAARATVWLPAWPSVAFLLRASTVGWLAGVALFSLWILWQWGRAVSLWRRTPTLATGPERDLLDRCQREMNIRRRVTLKQTDRLSSPAVFGYWRPCILLPELSRKLTTEELRLVFIHELTHVRRGDVGLNWCIAAAGAVHWFNPLLKRAFASMQRVRELACDEAVLAWLKPDERAAYARTVLRVIELSQLQSVTQPALLVGLAGLFNHQDPVAQLDERIRMITTSSPRSTFSRRWLLPGLCMVALGWLGFTQAQESAPPATDAAAKAGIEWLTRLKDDTKPTSAGEWKEYDVTEIRGTLARALGSRPGATSETDVMEWARGIADEPRPAEWAPEDIVFDGKTGKRVAAPPAEHRGAAAEYRLERSVSKRTTEATVTSEGRLALRATAAGHQRLAAVLASVREHGLHEFVVETRVAQITSQELQDLPIEWDYFTPLAPGQRRPLVPSEEAEKVGASPIAGASVTRTQERTVMTKSLDDALAAKIQSLVAGKTLTNPKVTLLEGHRAQIMSSQIRRPFVVGMQGDDPRGRLYTCGWHMDLQPTISQSGQLRLFGDYERSEITRVDITKILRRGKEVGVQVPEFETTQISLASDMASGQTLAFVIPAATPANAAEKATTNVQLVLCQVTSRLLTPTIEGLLDTRVYPVADLVVPIPKFEIRACRSRSGTDCPPSNTGQPWRNSRANLNFEGSAPAGHHQGELRSAH